MENTHQKVHSEFKLLDGQKSDFNLIWANFVYLFNHTLELFKKDPANYILIFAIPVIAGGALSVIVFPLLLGGLLAGGVIGLFLGLLIFVFCSVVLSIVAYLALLKAVIDKSKGQKLDLAAVFKYGFSHALNSVILSIKAFLTIFTGLHNFINAFFSLIYYVENGQANVDAAIKTSQEKSSGKTMTILWAYILLGLATGVISSVITSLWINIFYAISWDVAKLGTYVGSGVVSSFAVLAHYTLKGEIEKLGGHKAISSEHKA